MFLLVLLSCLASGIVLAEETEVNSTSSIREFKVPTPPSNKRYSLYQYQLNWDQALQFCVYMKQQLGTFNTIVEFNSLTSLIQQNGGAAGYHYWTAGIEQETNKYIWKTTGTPLNYTNWCPGEGGGSITAYDKNERCIDVREEYYNYCLRRVKCATLNYVICENTPNNTFVM